MRGGSARDHPGHLAGVQVELLLRIVLQDALSEVTKIRHPLKLRVFVDEFTALLMEKNKEVAEMAKMVMRKLKEEVEKKGLILSITEKEK